MAHVSGVALVIGRDLIGRKLVEQERLARDIFRDTSAASTVATAPDRLQSAETIDSMRILESQAALAYWSCWRNLSVLFPKTYLSRVPDHWRTFGARISPLTGSPRLAANPPGAMLNYLYTVLESEARLAASALGLDPGLGVMHADTKARDSLACDLMEPIRPRVDAFVLDWLTRQPLRRTWFFEGRNGNCRLMGSFAERLSEVAERIARPHS
jgi:CRISPR-associated endonuclease Cas1